MRLKLFWKLGLSYLLLLLLALVVVYLYTVRVLERNFLESTYSSLESLVRLAESRPPDVDDADGLQAWTTWLARSGARVTVVANDGVVLAESDEDPLTMDNHARRPEIREALERGVGRAERFSNTVKRDMVYLAVRSDWGQGSPVVLRVSRAQVQVNAAIAEVRGPMASISLVVLMAGGMLSLVFSRLFSERIRRLQMFSRRVSEGDFRPAPAEMAGDELSELSSTLNETAERLSSTIASLEEERNQSRALLSSMAEGVAVVDREQRIRFANRTFRDELWDGIASDGIEGRPLTEVAGHPRLLSMVSRVLETGERAEGEISTTGSESQDLLVRVASAGDQGAVVVLLDITDIRRLERVRRDFVANVSHELKTPLTAIQGFAETLLSGALDEPENSRRFATIIRDHANRLGRITDDLLKLSRIEAGKLDVDVKSVAVREIVNGCVELSKFRAQEKKLSVELDLSDDALSVLAEPNALAEVLQNLIDNAIQYTPDGRRIIIRSEAGGSVVRLSVIDDGIGIPAESHDRIFERFYRVDAARSRSVGGTGLGLSISKHLVESMGGTLTVTSTLGQGSAFTVTLPSPV